MKSVFHYKNGTPRQPTVCSHARGSVTIQKDVFNNPEHSLDGLEQFSHVWIMFLFHKNNNVHTKAKVKPPRLDGKKVGVFSTRSPYRPNAIGLTLAAVESIQGSTLFLKGIDILDGSPILDIKPYIPSYDKPNFHEPATDEMKTCDTVSSCDAGCNNDLESDVRLNTKHCDGEMSVEKNMLPCFATGTDINSLQEENEHGIRLCDGTEENKNESCAGVSSREVTPNSLYGHCEGAVSLLLVDSVSHLPSQESLARKITVLEDYEMHCEGEKTPGFQICENKQNLVMQTKNQEISRSDETVKTADWLKSSSVQKLDVRFTPTALQQLQCFSSTSSDSNNCLQLFSSVSEVQKAITEVLNEDPRSVYRRHKCKDSLYYFAIDVVHVTCWFDGDTAEVVRIQSVALVPQCS